MEQPTSAGVEEGERRGGGRLRDEIVNVLARVVVSAGHTHGDGGGFRESKERTQLASSTAIKL